MNAERDSHSERTDLDLAPASGEAEKSNPSPAQMRPVVATDKAEAIAPSAATPRTRRQFLKTFTGGIAVLWLVGHSDGYAQPEAGESGRGGRGPNRRPTNLEAWLHIGADGTVTVFSGKTEVGQNVRTSLTQAVAEELPIGLGAIRLVLADTALVPFDQGTFGSQSTPQMVPQIRRAAATARNALLDLAAKGWGVEHTALTIADGKIVHAASQRSIGFGELTKGEKLVLEISDRIPLKPATEWKVMGTSVPKVDGRNYVTGRHAYTSDISGRVGDGGASSPMPSTAIVVPGLQHGRVLRPAAFGAALTSLDASAAESLAGVTVVRDGDFVGVVAPTEHLAAQAIAALRADWKATPRVSERELFKHLLTSARTPPPPEPTPAHGTLSQTYTLAYIAHAPLEPRAAVAKWKGDQLTVWTGTQRPFGVRTELAQAFRIPEEAVRVIVPDTGSGYGGKHTGEAAIEAARLAKGAGKPVKLVWTREEEFTWAYFRPAGVIQMTSAVDAAGKLTRWEHRNYNSGNAGLRALYDVPARKEEFIPSQTPLKQGSYRALAATANHFARETHIDELARAANADPLAFRLNNLSDPRARAVLEAATERFGWKAKREQTAGTGFGLAVGFDKGGYLATCAEIHVDRASGKVRVVRVVQSFECGAVVNPSLLKNQIEGGIVQGIGGALFEAVRFENGRILNPRFAAYRVPRFSDLPAIDVVLLDRKDLPSAGAGEAPIVGIAPAVGNAIFDATNVRLRSLPLVPNGLKVS